MKKRDEFLKDLRQITGQSYEDIPRSSRTGGQAFLLLDVSGSMGGSGKLNQAKSGAEGYAAQAMQSSYSVGLIPFGSTASIVVDPCDDLAKFTQAANALTLDGSTNMTAAFQLAIASLESYEGARAICVVTDGMPNDPNGVIREADRAKEARIHITARGTDDANLEFLRKISSEGEMAEVVAPRLLGSSMRDAAKLLPPAGRRRLR